MATVKHHQKQAVNTVAEPFARSEAQGEWQLPCFEDYAIFS
jgi:hypothetical protein